MLKLLQNEHFWVYLAFLIFILIFGKLIYKQIKNFLEQQIIVIKDNINSTKKPLEESIKLLKKQKSELVLLNDKIQKLKQKDKETSNMIIESFYENLNTKLQYIEENFNNYLKNKDLKHFNNLTNGLMNDSYNIIITILKEHLSESQKQHILNTSIINLEKALINKTNL